MKLFTKGKVNLFWSITNSSEVLNKFKSKRFKTSKLSIYDFSTLSHHLIKDNLFDLIERTFSREQALYLACNEERVVFVFVCLLLLLFCLFCLFVFFVFVFFFFFFFVVVVVVFVCFVFFFCCFFFFFFLFICCFFFFFFFFFSLLMSTKIISDGLVKTFVKPLFIFWIIFIRFETFS